MTVTAVYHVYCSVFECVGVCYSVLQCVAAACCCSVLLQCVVVVCCSVLQSVAVCCRVLQSVAVCCSVLQSVAECCRVLQSVAECCRAHHSHVTETCKTCRLRIARRYKYWQAQVSVLTLSAGPDTVLRLLARSSAVTVQHCNTLQHTATHCTT